MKKSIVLLSSIALLASCSSDYSDIVGDAVTNYADEIVLTSKTIEFENDTRPILTAGSSGLDFYWKDRDEIGVFPVEPYTNCQAMQVITLGGNNESSLNFVFNGAGWKLDSEGVYAAYFPYNGDLPSKTPYTAVPIDMTGQTQNGDAATDHIGSKYDYIYAVSTTKVDQSGNKKLNFDFSHAVAIIQLNLTMPVAATWSNVTLTNTSGDAVFATKGMLNVYTGEVTSSETSSSISLDVENVSTSAANQTLVLYMAALPTTTGSLQITATTSDGEVYSQNVDTKTYRAGKGYRYVASLVANDLTTGLENGYEWVDLGLSVKWATRNIGAVKAYDYGSYFAWGETEARTSGFNWNNYGFIKEGTTVSSNIEKYQWPDKKYDAIWYDNQTFIGDGKSLLDSEDDAARVNWGGRWKIPNSAEMKELIDNCTWTWMSDYNNSGIAGYLVTSNKDGFTDKSIFLPAGGNYTGNSINSNGEGVFLWTSSLYVSSYNSETISAYALNAEWWDVDDFEIGMSNSIRSLGLTIRPVWK